jgi:hypothetical protein
MKKSILVASLFLMSVSAFGGDKKPVLDDGAVLRMDYVTTNPNQ